MTAQSFFNQVYSDARSVGCNHVQAAICAAQSAIETGWGKSVKGNSYFGVKAGRSWTGRTIDFTTHEIVNGERVKVVDRFRAYDSLQDSLHDYKSMLFNRFPTAWNAETIKDAANGLNHGVYGSYATDPDYSKKVLWTAAKRSAVAKTIFERSTNQPQIMPNNVTYVNQDAIRNRPCTANLVYLFGTAIVDVFGAGTYGTIYSGGQDQKGHGKRRTGSIRHDDYGDGGRALDGYIYRSDGSQIIGLDLARLGQYWIAKGYGSCGLEMSGGGIHLDEWNPPPRGGALSWTYAYSDAKHYGARMKAMLMDGRKGILPDLRYAQPEQEPPVRNVPPKPKIKSTTLWASWTAKITATLTAVGTIWKSTDPAVQILIAGGAIIIIILLMWISRERIKKLARGI